MPRIPPNSPTISGNSPLREPRAASNIQGVNSASHNAGSSNVASASNTQNQTPPLPHSLYLNKRRRSFDVHPNTLAHKRARTAMEAKLNRLPTSIKVRYKNAEANLEKLFSVDGFPEARAETDENFLRYWKAQGVPDDVKEFAQLVNDVIRDGHYACDHGRPNVQVRNKDVLRDGGHDYLHVDMPGAEAASKTDPDEINIEATLEKMYLSLLADEMVNEMEDDQDKKIEDDNDSKLDNAFKHAGAAVFTGAALCTPLTALTAFAIAHKFHCLKQEGKAQFGDVALEIIKNPSLEGEPVDHEYCRATYTDKSGDAHCIIIDPWAGVNTPVLVKNSRYENGELSVRIPKDYDFKGALAKRVVESAFQAEAAMYSFGLDENIRKYRETLVNADKSKEFSLKSSNKGFVDIDMLDMTKDISPPLKVRRNSLEPASNSQLRPDFL